MTTDKVCEAVEEQERFDILLCALFWHDIKDLLTDEVRAIVEGHLAGQRLIGLNYYVATGAVDVVFAGGGFIHEKMTVTPCRPPVSGCKARVTNYKAVREESDD